MVYDIATHAVQLPVWLALLFGILGAFGIAQVVDRWLGRDRIPPDAIVWAVLPEILARTTQRQLDGSPAHAVLTWVPGEAPKGERHEWMDVDVAGRHWKSLRCRPSEAMENLPDETE